MPRHPTGKPNGRPSKQNDPAIREKLLEALRAGSTRRAACAYADISEDTLAVMLKNRPGFTDEVKKAEGKAEVTFQSIIARAAKDETWTAAAWWLERRRPMDYGRTDKHFVQAQVDSRNVNMSAELNAAVLRAMGWTGELVPLGLPSGAPGTPGNGSASNGNGAGDVDLLPEG